MTTTTTGEEFSSPELAAQVKTTRFLRKCLNLRGPSSVDDQLINSTVLHAGLIEAAVFAFHEKNDFIVGYPLKFWSQIPDDQYDPSRNEMQVISNRLGNMAIVQQERAERLIANGDIGGFLYALRAHLILEELGELFKALHDRDEEGLMDAMGDVMYVIIGLGVSAGLPAESALYEVCRSNLTKEPRKKDDMRLRDKGASWSPPDMKSILERRKVAVERCST